MLMMGRKKKFEKSEKFGEREVVKKGCLILMRQPVHRAEDQAKLSAMRVLNQTCMSS